MLTSSELAYRAELDQLARDVLYFEHLTKHAAERQHWRNVAEFDRQRELVLDRRYDVLRHYLAMRQSRGQTRWWWQ